MLIAIAIGGTSSIVGCVQTCPRICLEQCADTTHRGLVASFAIELLAIAVMLIRVAIDTHAGFHPKFFQSSGARSVDQGAVGGESPANRAVAQTIAVLDNFHQHGPIDQRLSSEETDVMRFRWRSKPVKCRPRSLKGHQLKVRAI